MCETICKILQNSKKLSYSSIKTTVTDCKSYNVRQTRKLTLYGRNGMHGAQTTKRYSVAKLSRWVKSAWLTMTEALPVGRCQDLAMV